MLAIAVHHNENITHRRTQTGDNSRGKTSLPTTPDDAEVRTIFRQKFSNLPGSIGRIVVHNDDFKRHITHCPLDLFE